MNLGDRMKAATRPERAAQALGADIVIDLDAEDVGHLVAEHRTAVAEIERLRAIITTARHTADHWRRWALDAEMGLAAHALCMVLAALDGETDPAQLGIGIGPPDDIPAWGES